MVLLTFRDYDVQETPKKFLCSKCGVRLKKAEKTIFAKTIRYFFIIFNVVMLIYFILRIIAAEETVKGLARDAELSEITREAGIRLLLVLFVWIVGNMILVIIDFIAQDLNIKKATQTNPIPFSNENLLCKHKPSALWEA